MKCESCEHYIRALDTCKFCYYKEKGADNQLLKWNGLSYRLKSLEVSNDGTGIKTEWEIVE